MFYLSFFIRALPPMHPDYDPLIEKGILILPKNLNLAFIYFFLNARVIILASPTLNSPLRVQSNLPLYIPDDAL